MRTFVKSIIRIELSEATLQRHPYLLRWATSALHHDTESGTHRLLLLLDPALPTVAKLLLLAVFASSAANSKKIFLKFPVGDRTHDSIGHWRCIPESPVPTVGRDTHPAHPIHLSYDTISLSLLEKLTVSFSSFGILSHTSARDARWVVIKQLRSFSVRIYGFRNSFMPSRMFLSAGRTLWPPKHV